MMEQVKAQYVNPGLAGSFSGSAIFYRALKSRIVNVKRKEVMQWLKTQDTYTLHKPKRKKFQRNKVIVSGIDETWQIDLVDLRNIERGNRGFKYLITCIDVFSKYVWVKPLKNKYGKTVTDAFKEILQEAGTRRPKNVQADKGSEFFNSNFDKLLKENDIKLYAINSEMKACIVERFNRTLKEKMWRYFTASGKHVYIDIIQELIQSYNDTYHRTIKMKPNHVNKDNEKDVWRALYGFLEHTSISFKFKVGEKVRISRVKDTFEKGYTPNWTQEIFIITERLPRKPPVYRIKDLADDAIEGTFYETELQSVAPDTETFKIDHIIRRRTRNGEKELLVRWLGYPSKFDSWIKASDIVGVKK